MVDLDAFRKMLREGKANHELRKMLHEGDANHFEAVAEMIAFRQFNVKTARPLNANNLCIEFSARFSPDGAIEISVGWEDSNGDLFKIGINQAEGPDLAELLVKYPSLKREKQRAHASHLLWKMGRKIDRHIYVKTSVGSSTLHSDPLRSLLAKSDVLVSSELEVLSARPCWIVPEFELVEFVGMSTADAKDACQDHDTIVDAVLKVSKWYTAAIF